MKLAKLIFVFVCCALVLGWLSYGAGSRSSRVATKASPLKKNAPLATPLCVFGTATARPESVLNSPCRVDLHAVATDDRGAQTASAPSTIFLLPADRWPLRIEIEGDKQMMLAVGETQTLQARVWDQNGIEVAWPVRWRASQFAAQPAISVGELDGVVRGLARGDALVTATAQNIASRSVRVNVR